jgi:putative CRISPR-associated protein (TIGR02619 family)
VDAWLRSADLKRASAETHTWLKLNILDEPQRHRLVLVHTNTADGRYCARRLKTWAEGQGLECEVDEIEGLGAERGHLQPRPRGTGAPARGTCRERQERAVP